MSQIKVHSFQLESLEFRFQDLASSDAVPIIMKELARDSYGLKKIPFKAGDVVLDIGGHVGCFSIVLARMCPKIQIYAFEPVPANAENFRQNLIHNQVHNVDLIPKAVTSDGRPITLYPNPQNTGAVMSPENYRMKPQPGVHSASVTLNAIFKAYQIQRCKLLKLDCEGFEFELLYHFAHLDQVDFLSAELHIQADKAHGEHNLQALKAYCESFIPAEHLHFDPLLLQHNFSASQVPKLNPG